MFEFCIGVTEEEEEGEGGCQNLVEAAIERSEKIEVYMIRIITPFLVWSVTK